MRNISNSLKSGLTVILMAVVTLSVTSCNMINPKNDPITFGAGYQEWMFASDKACYAPGETVMLSLNKQPDTDCRVCYYHQAELIQEEPLVALRWTWQPPTTDYAGYLVCIVGEDGHVYSSIGVDVSSEPTRFPRNGFLSAYGNMSESEIDAQVEKLSRYHINYVQFQDWHWKHHHPLAGTSIQPMDVWTDIISRNCYRSTVDGYIAKLHERGAKCLFYNLIYGALDDAIEDSVKREWYVFKDRHHLNPDMHELSSPFKSSIYLVNPANEDWQRYLAAQHDEVYKVFDFDGYQIDQLGYRGYDVYDYVGNFVELSEGFAPFIHTMKAAQPNKRIVMNAVGQYGQEYIANTDVDFLYTEVWDTLGYAPISSIITNNDRMGGGKKTVLAAYMDYQTGKRGRGYFNTHGVLLTTAAIHAWGGAMLQLGEHMLTTEYFPNNNLSMNSDLQQAMIHYYDVITAYETLLRDGGEWVGIDMVAPNGEIAFRQWPPEVGSVATVGKNFADKQVIHLLNFDGAKHTDWVDNNANQGNPKEFENIQLQVALPAAPGKVYAASPDYKAGMPVELEMSYDGGILTLTLPYLHYWTMIVVEK